MKLISNINSLNLNILNEDGQSALHLAVITNQPIIVNYLILNGANNLIRDYNGNTALHLACNYGLVDCANAIIKPLLIKDFNNWSTFKFLQKNFEQRNYNGKFSVYY